MVSSRNAKSTANRPPDMSLQSHTMTLSGSAVQSQDATLLLTPNQISQTGSAFFSIRLTPDTCCVFEIDFTITPGSDQDQGADGMALVCLYNKTISDGGAGQTKQNLVGDGGSGLGYDGLGGPNDWAVEIDTYQT